MEKARKSKEEKTASRLIVPIFAGTVGVVLVVLGWLIPSQFKSLPASVLAEAGRGTPRLHALIDDQLDAGRPGVAEVYANTLVVLKMPADSSLEQVARFEEEIPT